jgi:hypothetical protein
MDWVSMAYSLYAKKNGKKKNVLVRMMMGAKKEMFCSF